MVFIGPNDLALSILGYLPARGDEPEFVAAIHKIVAAARRHGKWVARLSNDGAACREHLQIFDTDLAVALAIPFDGTMMMPLMQEEEALKAAVEEFQLQVNAGQIVVHTPLDS